MFYQKTKPESDHAFHLNTINRIKTNGHRFIKDYLFSVNEKYPFYPQLYHWILSFLPEKLYKEKYIRINITIKLLEIISFNAFLLYIQGSLGFKDIVFLYANIVFHSFPFSYAAWNAKNTGLSARGIGLVTGQIYLYLLIAYLLSGSFWLLVPIFLIVFIILLMSQMTLQFILLSLPFFVLVFSIPEIFPMPFIAFGIFYLIMPKVARNYIIGQFNHKRNYALFIADIFILKSRPSIYRDFIYDFWHKLQTNWRLALFYIYRNPLLELLYGFSFLWFVIYRSYNEGYETNLNKLFLFSMISLLLFFITSFNKTRFLGEPQRYVEFAIPLIAVLFSMSYDWKFLLSIIIMNVFVILLPSVIIKNNYDRSFANQTKNRSNLLNFLIESKMDKSHIYISNSVSLLRYLFGIGCLTINIDYSRWYKNKSDYYKYVYDYSLGRLSPFALTEYEELYEASVFIYDNKIKWTEKMAENFDFSKWKLKTKIGEYDIYCKHIFL
ncbi:MAG: hypothetical protein WCR58_04435 [Bacteroidales bacterium]|jgi:hypothetical protein|nr:hypothetical protein [Bacteroidales bacterium]